MGQWPLCSEMVCFATISIARATNHCDPKLESISQMDSLMQLRVELNQAALMDDCQTEFEYLGSPFILVGIKASTNSFVTAY